MSGQAWDNQQSGGALFAAAPAMVNTWIGGADMAQRTCSVDGCEHPHVARGWCNKHWLRWQRHGDTAHERQHVPVPTRDCSVESCDRVAYCRDLCQAHYARLGRYGSPMGGAQYGVRGLSPAEKFWRYVDRPSADACWTWTGSLSHNGYGRSHDKKVRSAAHRVAYELTYGPIPAGMELDHTCHSRSGCQMGDQCPHRACVNPEHLEVVTSKENSRRSWNRLR